MSRPGRSDSGIVGLSVSLTVVPLVASFLTGLWVFTAIPVGFLFGFCLQKGDLCGASAMTTLLGNWATTRVYLMGEGLWPARRRG